MTTNLKKRLKKKFRNVIKQKEEKEQQKIDIEEISKNPKVEQLKSLFTREIYSKRSGEEEREKIYKPVIEKLENVVNAVKDVDMDIKKIKSIGNVKPRLQIQPSVSITPKPIKSTESFTPIIEEPNTPMVIRDVTPNQRLTFKEAIDEHIIGKRPSYYLSFVLNKEEKKRRGVDSVFGIYFDDFTFKIGKLPVEFEGDYIIVNKEKFLITDGLLRLLTYRVYITSDFYTEEDLKKYIKILFLTESMYHNNDKTTNRPKTSPGDKWKSLVSHIYAYTKNCNFDILDDCIDEFINTTKKTGSGIKLSSNQLSNNPVEYKYFENLTQLLQRLYFILAEEKAGNNSFHNEKIGILKLCKSELEKVLDTEKGTEYLIRVINVLPKKIVGSGIVNSIIDNLPFEMHWPGYQYLGPGTKLDKRLSRGDKGINPLDEAAKEHDICYSENKDLETRHKCDEKLEYKAWDRVLSKNSDWGEKIPAWATTTAMKVKRRFGMGLKF